MPACKALNAKGNPCMAYAVTGHSQCMFHLPQDIRNQMQKAARERLISKKEFILDLQRQYRKVRHMAGNEIEKSKEMRSLLDKIMELKGEKSDETEEPTGLEKKVNKWQKNQA